jgi:hypothetical protein
MYVYEVKKWMKTSQFRNLSRAMSDKVCDILSTKSRIESDSYSSHSGTSNSSSGKKSFTVYLAADNALVKEALFSFIQHSVRQSTRLTCQSLKLPLTMVMLNVSNIVHTSDVYVNSNTTTSSKILLKSSHSQSEYYSSYPTMFDWYMISAAKHLLNWARYENRYRVFYSTYTQTSRYLKTISDHMGPDYTLKINRLKTPVWIEKDKNHWG